MKCFTITTTFSKFLWNNSLPDVLKWILWMSKNIHEYTLVLCNQFKTYTLKYGNERESGKKRMTQNKK
jgi:hypothetical protein